jgi:tRNA modification GTPase
VTLKDPVDGAPLDDGLALLFPAPASFTGEDVVEFHLHGSPAVIDHLFRVLAALGLRTAIPGEFSRRAFANGKMDLTAAEGLADLIAADTEAQREQALAQMGGAWARVISDWQGRLLDVLSILEASIDFADEDDVPDDVADSVPKRLGQLASDMARQLEDGRRGEIVRDGLRVAIVGPPNVGKSTLLNALAGREAAIVSDIPGTTRDVVEVRLDLDGYVVVLADTAGLRPSDDPIEIEGIRRARDRASTSDLRVFVMDSRTRVGLETESLLQPGDIIFANKSDLHAALPEPVAGAVTLSGSALTGEGLHDLVETLRAHMREALAASPTLVTRHRHRECLSAAHEAVVRAAVLSDVDLAAADIRQALQALARIIGRFDVEQVLDRVFSQFCIGK